MNEAVEVKQESRYSSRKFLLALLVVFLGVLMTLSDHLTPQLVDLMKWTLGLYCGLNVTQKATELLTPKVGQ